MTEPGERPGAKLRLVGAADAERPDEELLRAFLGGEDRAFGALVKRHQRLVLAVVGRYAASPDDALDLAQRAFLKAFEAARRSTWLGAPDLLRFRAWLLRIAVNLGKNHARDARRWLRAAPEEAESVPVSATGTAGLERAERERAVRAAVLDLPRRQRQVFALRIDAELSFREVAAALGITENNAKVHFHHAAKRLRAAIAEGGW
jgi:RNA polymerase sigma-70 factor (ECF subfamily)